MTIINFNIHKAKKRYDCARCREWIMPNAKYARMFGYAEFGDPVYEIFEHIECLEEHGADSEEIINILKKGNHDYEIINGKLKLKI